MNGLAFHRRHGAEENLRSLLRSEITAHPNSSDNSRLLVGLLRVIIRRVIRGMIRWLIRTMIQWIIRWIIRNREQPFSRSSGRSVSTDTFTNIYRLLETECMHLLQSEFSRSSVSRQSQWMLAVDDLRSGRTKLWTRSIGSIGRDDKFLVRSAEFLNRSNLNTNQIKILPWFVLVVFVLRSLCE